jgi:CubicO group peptidase (beta-lactamase class C family)
MAKLKVLGILVFLLMASCGGGGGSAPREPSAPSPVGAAATSLLAPSWNLERVEAASLGLSAQAVENILLHVFTDKAVQSATLVKDGYIVGERFSDGVTASTLGTSWSVAKSFYSAAIGIAIEQGWIASLDQKASVFLPQWQGTSKENITIRHMLEMRAGIDDSGSIFTAFDQTEYAVNAPKVRQEGVEFAYSNATSQLFEPLIRAATGLDAHAFLRQELLSPMGIDTNLVGMWLDPSGNHPLTYMGLDMRPVDMAKFGLLYARDGEWDGSQVLPAQYVQASLTAQSAYYGFQWWILNAAFLGQPATISVAAALGLNGQKIYVWADKDVVLVVQTQYQHSQNQGYVLSSTNFPDTCTGRNSCPGATGGEVEGYSEIALVNFLAALEH